MFLRLLGAVSEKKPVWRMKFSDQWDHPAERFRLVVGGKANGMNIPFTNHDGHATSFNIMDES